MTGDNFRRSFIRDHLIVVVGHALVYANGWILMPIVIKTVGVEVYGEFVMLSLLLNLAFGVSSLGAGFNAQRGLPSTPDAEGRSTLFYPQFYFQMSMALALGLAWVLAKEDIDRYFLDGNASYSAWLVPAYLVTYAFFGQAAMYYRYTGRVGVMTLAVVVFPAMHLSAVMAWALATKSVSIDVLFLAQVGAAVSVAAPLFWQLSREVGFAVKVYAWRALTEDVRVGFPLVVNLVVDIALAAADRYVIALFLGLAAVGTYNPAYVIGSAVVFVPKAISTALPQLLSKAADGGHWGEASNMLTYAIRAFLLLAIPFVFGSIVLAEDIVEVLGNADVAQGSRGVAPLVALGTVFYGLGLILGNALFVQRNTKGLLKMNLYAGVANVVGNVVLLALFRNIIWAAVTTLLSYLLMFAYVRRALSAEWHIRWHLAGALRSVAASAIMAGTLVLVRQAVPVPVGFWPVCLLVLSGVAVYVVSLFAVGGVTTKEIAIVHGMYAAR